MQINHVSFENIPAVPDSIINKFVQKEQKIRYSISHIIIPFLLLGIDIAVFVYIWNSCSVISCIVAGLLFTTIAFVFIFFREKIGHAISKKIMQNWMSRNNINISAESIRNMNVYQKWIHRETDPTASTWYILQEKALTVCDTDIQGRRFKYNFTVRRIRESFTQEDASFDLANSILTLPCDKFGRLTGGMCNEEN